MEAYVSAHYLNHVISFGKQDEWLGPGMGGGMAYSNNAENIYAFHINRIEPLHVPGLSRLTGPFRYEFLVGPLQGATIVSERPLGARGKDQLQAHGEPGVRLRAHRRSGAARATSRSPSIPF